ncbi:MAG: peptidoglycan editing factor PgeF [Xanthomonadales bacterium]|nr:peptidoglycan editing factor PgeF [Xanthomonadales bacterium]
MIDTVIRAHWQAPARVQAFTTTRRGPGESQPPFDVFNLGDHVGDDPAAVVANRAALWQTFALPAEPLWLRQVHGTQVADADVVAPGEVPEADAAVTREPGRVLAILTADCLPVVFAADDASSIGAAHAGWRGLADGVLEATVAAMRHDPSRIHAWIGPGIRQAAFEVGPEVRERFVVADRLAFAAFKPSARPGHFLCDLAMLARLRLMKLGLVRIADCALCTHVAPQQFYSHRRDQRTGRMATLVWQVQTP